MPIHAWTILCQGVVENPVTRNLSLTEIVDEITVTPSAHLVPGPLVVQLGWHLVTAWRRTLDEMPEEFVQRVSLRGPTGHVTQTAMIPVSLLNPFTRARMIAGVPALVISGAGRHEFIVEHAPTPNGPWAIAGVAALNIIIAG